MKKTINGKEYELVKTDIKGCADCDFHINDDDDGCDKAGHLCFKSCHRNDYPMVWKEVKNDDKK